MKRQTETEPGKEGGREERDKEIEGDKGRQSGQIVRERETETDKEREEETKFCREREGEKEEGEREREKETG